MKPRDALELLQREHALMQQVVHKNRNQHRRTRYFRAFVTVHRAAAHAAQHAQRLLQEADAGTKPGGAARKSVRDNEAAAAKKAIEKVSLQGVELERSQRGSCLSLSLSSSHPSPHCAPPVPRPPMQSLATIIKYAKVVTAQQVGAGFAPLMALLVGGTAQYHACLTALLEA